MEKTPWQTKLNFQAREAFNQYVFIPARPGATRQLEILNPELIDTAFLCLAEQGKICDIDL